MLADKAAPRMHPCSSMGDTAGVTAADSESFDLERASVSLPPILIEQRG
jgi:hypothetical protein